MPHSEYIITLILLLLAIEDYIHLSISPFIFGLLIAASLIGENKIGMLVLLAILSLLWTISKTIRKGIGFADIIIISCCYAFLKTTQLGLFLILIGGSATLVLKIFKKTKVPLIPFIFLSFMLIKYSITKTEQSIYIFPNIADYLISTT